MAVSDTRPGGPFNGVQVANSPLTISGVTISIPAATTSVDGYLLHTDWNTFNGKLNVDFSNVTGTLPIANGGTGHVTAITAFNALSPMSSEGDLLYYHSGSATRLPIGTNGYVLGSNGTDPVWILAGTGTVSTATAPLFISGSNIYETQANTSTDGYLVHADWNTFNNKQNALTFGSIAPAYGPLSVTNGTNSTVGPNVTITLPKADTTHDGYLTSTDWNNFNSGSGAIQTASAPLFKSGQNIYETQANASTDGYLVQADWNTFNNKQNALTFGTTSSAYGPLTVTNGANSTVGPNVVITLQKADSTHDGYLTSTDWNNFNSGSGAIQTASAPLFKSGQNIYETQANASTDGYLTSTDWNTFNNKQAVLTFNATAHQTTVSEIGTTVTYGTVQNIDTSSTPTFAGETLTGALTVQEISTPAAPASGYIEIYPKVDNHLYFETSDGYEHLVHNSIKNYVLSPNNASQWVSQNVGFITVTTDTTAADLPRAITSLSGIKFTGVSSNNGYAYYRFHLDTVDYSVPMMITFALNPLAGYVASDMRIDMYVNPNADYSGSYIRLALSTDVASVTGIPATEQTFTAQFTASTSTNPYYELRVGLNGTNTHSIVISDLFVTPNVTNLAKQVTGILPTANGGTGISGSAVFPTSGTVDTGTGTSNTVAKWTGSSTLGNSSITDDGSLVTVGEQLKITAGTVSAPALYFDSDTNTGFYHLGTAEIGVSANGVLLNALGARSTAGAGEKMGQLSLWSTENATSTASTVLWSSRQYGSTGAGIQSGDWLWRQDAGGSYNGGNDNTNPTIRVIGSATQNWTSATFGSQLQWQLVPTGSNALSTILTMNGTMLQTGAGIVLELQGLTSGYVDLAVPSTVSSSYTFTLPSSGGTNHYTLHTNGSGTTSWGLIDLTTDVTGILPTANGGTGQNSTATFPTSGTVNTGAGTTNKVPKYTNGASGVIGNSSISDDGTNVTVTEPILATNTTQSTTDATGAVIVSGGIGVAKNIVSNGQIVSTRYDNGNSGSAATIDFNNGNVQDIVLTANCTFTFSNPIDGGTYTLLVTQDATGSRTVTWPGTVVWPATGAPTLTTSANAVDIISFVYESSVTTYYGVPPSGSGTGTVTGTGTTNTLSKWTSSTAIGNSSITDNGSLVTVGEQLKITGGSAAAPALYMSTDTNTGIYSPATGQIGIASGGALLTQLGCRGGGGANVNIGQIAMYSNEGTTAGDCTVIYQERSKGSTGAGIQSGDSLGRFEFDGNDGTSVPSGSPVIIRVSATETWSHGSALGSKISFGVTKTGTTTLVTALTLTGTTAELGAGVNLVLDGSTSGAITVSAGATPSSYTFTLPSSGGTNKYTLTTNGSGTTSWSQLDLTAGVTGTLPIANGGTNSAASLNNNRFIVSSGGAIVEAAAVTASRAVVSDSNGLPTASATTSTEIGYVSGVTSAIQTQLNGKASTALDNLASVAVNLSLTPGTDNSINLGSASKTWASGFVAGMVYGTGDTTGTTAGATLRGVATTGTNKVGVDTTVQAGNGTGTGGSGNIIFQTAPTGSTGTTANTFATVLTLTPSSDIIFGKGELSGTPVGSTLRAPSASGTNVAAANVTLSAGKGTGTGTPGTVYLQTYHVAASGTTLQGSPQILFQGNSTGVQILGNTDGSTLPSAGYVGEYLEATASATSLTTGVKVGITSGITLTPGIWDVTGTYDFLPNTAASTIWVESFPSTSTGNDFTSRDLTRNTAVAQSVQSTGVDVIGPLPVWRVNITSNTTYYLKVVASFGGTCTGAGMIRATRIA